MILTGDGAVFATGNNSERSPGASNSAQDTAAAGIWTMVLHGMTMVIPLIVAVPPHWLCGRLGHSAR